MQLRLKPKDLVLCYKKSLGDSGEEKLRSYRKRSAEPGAGRGNHELGLVKRQKKSLER